MKANKRGALFMALFVAVSTVFPVRDSRAAVPLVGLAVAAISNSGAVVSADLLTSGVTALIGGSIAALAITPNNADAPVRVPLISDKATIDAVMPPPSAAPSTDPVQGTGYVGPDKNYPDAASACMANATYGMLTRYNDSNYGWCSQSVAIKSISGASCTYTVTATPEGGGASFSRGDYTISLYQTPTTACPAGYNLSGSSCVLVAPRQIADNKADVTRSVSGFTYPTTGGDIDPMPSYASASGGKVYAQGKNSAGKPVMIEYSVSADGSKTYITHYTQSEDATQTTVKTQSITVDAATGAITGATSGTAAGSIAPATDASSVPTVTTGAAVTSGSSSSEPIVFPSDYARVGEAAQAAQVVKTAVDGVKERLTTTETLNDPLVPEWVDPWGMTWDGLKGWRLPSHASACPSGSFSWNGSQYLINGHCQLFIDYFSEFSAVMAVIWTVLALFIVLGA